MSSKQSNSQIREQIRQTIAKQYKERLDSLIKENKELKEKLGNQNNEIIDLQTKLKEYEEWIERMQEFCNMSEEDRLNYLEHTKQSEYMQQLFNHFVPFLSNFGVE